MSCLAGDFNSKSEYFGCASKNCSGPMLKSIQKTPGNSKFRQEQSYVYRKKHGVYIPKFINIWYRISSRWQLGQQSLAIELSVEPPPHPSITLTWPRYKRSQADKAHLQIHCRRNLRHISHKNFTTARTTNDLDGYANFAVSSITATMDIAILKTHQAPTEKQSISEQISCHRRNYSQLCCTKRNQSFKYLQPIF